MIIRFGLKAVDLKQKVPEIFKISIENILIFFMEGSTQVEADLNFENFLSKSRNVLYSVLYLNKEDLKEN